MRLLPAIETAVLVIGACPSGCTVAVTLPPALFTETSDVDWFAPIATVMTQSPTKGAACAGVGAADVCATPCSDTMENAPKYNARAAPRATQTVRIRLTMRITSPGALKTIAAG